MTTKIYLPLKLYFFSMLFTAIIGFIPAEQGSALDVLTTLLSLAVTVVTFFALYKLSPVSDRLRAAFRYNIVVLVLTGLLLVIALLMLANQENDSAISGILLLLLPVTVLLLVFVLLASYQFYWGLDELIKPNGYSYPEGRIKWCFCTALIGGVIGGISGLFVPLLAPIITLAVSAVQLFLLYEYLQAVRAREEQPLL